MCSISVFEEVFASRSQESWPVRQEGFELLPNTFPTYQGVLRSLAKEGCRVFSYTLPGRVTQHMAFVSMHVPGAFQAVMRGIHLLKNMFILFSLATFSRGLKQMEGGQGFPAELGDLLFLRLGFLQSQPS